MPRHHEIQFSCSLLSYETCYCTYCYKCILPSALCNHTCRSCHSRDICHSVYTDSTHTRLHLREIGNEKSHDKVKCGQERMWIKSLKLDKRNGKPGVRYLFEKKKRVEWTSFFVVVSWQKQR